MALMRILQAQTGFVLTKTKQLQTQYFEEFPEIQVCKGKKNYPCILPNQGHKTVDEALCQAGWPCNRKSYCPYFVDLKKARAASEVVFNYAMWLSSSQYAGMFTACDVLIADEGHELEKEVVKFSSIILRQPHFSKWGIDVPSFLEVEDYAEWAKQMRPRISNGKDALEKQLLELPEVITFEQERMLDSLRELSTLQRALSQVIAAPDAGRWYIRSWKNGSVEMVPVWASRHVRKIFDAAGTKAIVMSATLLPTEQTAKRMGLDSGYEFIEVDSNFDPGRSPILFQPVARLSRKNLEQKLPDLVTALDEILYDHLPDERGLVHTSNYYIRDYVLANSRFAKEMISHEGSNREVIIRDFLDGKGPPVLVSPSIGTGFDGKGDKARFQVILKYPFPDLGDPLVRMRMEEDKESYDYDANAAFIQTCGRIMRSYDDRGMTYVLDGQLSRMFSSRPNHFPKWVKERLV